MVGDMDDEGIGLMVQLSNINFFSVVANLTPCAIYSIPLLSIVFRDILSDWIDFD